MRLDPNKGHKKLIKYNIGTGFVVIDLFYGVISRVRPFTLIAVVDEIGDIRISFDLRIICDSSNVFKDRQVL